MIWILACLLCTPATFADNLALLSGTLRTYQVASCEGQVVGLSCPPGTCISVQLARYDISPPATNTLCPSPKHQSFVIPQPTCEIATAVQYSLLQTVVEACQKKRHCKFQSSAKRFGPDPCPTINKFVEVAYKCRPYEFRSKVACENDVVQLKCNPNSRLAIYSASYGRTEYESVQCPQPQGVPEQTCLVSYATETVMQICHGKRRCTLSADAATFGSPCKKESRMYLKVVYTCVPRKVLREQYEERPEKDELIEEPEPPDFDNYDAPDDSLYTDMFSPSPNLGRSNSSGGPRLAAPGRTPAPAATPSLHLSDEGAQLWEVQGDASAARRTDWFDDVTNINCTVNVYSYPRTRSVGFITEWISTYMFIANNEERFYLYLVVSVGGGLLALMALVITKLLCHRHRSSAAAAAAASKIDPAATVTLGATSLGADGFMDNVSEVEADMDLTAMTPNASLNRNQRTPLRNSSMMRYGQGGSQQPPAHYYYG